MSLIDALSPLDGRYESKITELKEYFSEYALIKYRVAVEIHWLKASLCRSWHPRVPQSRQR